MANLGSTSRYSLVESVTRSEIRGFTRSQLDRYMFFDVPITWGRSRNYIAQVHFVGRNPSEIRLSSKIMPLLSDDDAKDVILHELAHCLVGPNEGHGPLWREMAEYLGADPRRRKDLGNEILEKVSKYKTTCDTCHEVYYFNRRSEYPIEGRGCECGGKLKREEVLR